MLRLQNKVAVITGGTSRIGRAYTAQCAEAERLIARRWITRQGACERAASEYDIQPRHFDRFRSDADDNRNTAGT
jgi:NAD(P)-dependent dehydrogenase (short-subunit alcohol dehydrogenase family)